MLALPGRFLPMHIRVYVRVAARSRSWLSGSVLTPILSSLITGMPLLMPTMPVMVIELGISGGVVGYLYRRCHWPLIGAMTVGRLAAAVAVANVATITMLVGVQMRPLTYLIGAVSTGLPGIDVQLVFIPLLVKKLESVSVPFRQAKSREW